MSHERTKHTRGSSDDVPVLLPRVGILYGGIKGVRYGKGKNATSVRLRAVAAAQCLTAR
jgi:hypothetical protein